MSEPVQTTSTLRRGIVIGSSMFVILLLTLALLEGVARVIWWEGPVAAFGATEIELLPLSIVTEKQQDILAAWREADAETYIRFDPVLGWSINPGVSTTEDDVVYTSNSIGIRALREYDLQPPEGVTRIGAFGPSFTHGDDVDDGYSYPAQLEAMRADLEVMNWGVGGYGTDQSYLRYRTGGIAYAPDIVLIGFEEDNLGRNVNRFRPFFRRATGVPLTKPVFVLADESLALRDNPFKDVTAFENVVLNEPGLFLDIVCPDDFYCERAYFEPQPLDAFYSYRFLRTLWYQWEQATAEEHPVIRIPYVQQVNLGLLERFVLDAKVNGSEPVVVVFPNHGSMLAYEARQTTEYAEAIALLTAADVRVIDLASALVAAKQREGLDYVDLYAPFKGHFGRTGNRLVAEAVGGYLCEEGLLEDCESVEGVGQIERK